MPSAKAQGISRREPCPAALLPGEVDSVGIALTVLEPRVKHLGVPHHGAAFFGLLDKVMPDWERRKQRLERAMA